MTTSANSALGVIRTICVLLIWTHDKNNHRSCKYLPVDWAIACTVISLPQDDVIKWKHYSRYWPFVRGIHQSPVNSPHKGQWRRFLMFSLICARINGWVNNREAGDLRRHRAYYDVTVMCNISRKKPYLEASLGIHSRTTALQSTKFCYFTTIFEMQNTD